MMISDPASSSSFALFSGMAAEEATVKKTSIFSSRLVHMVQPLSALDKSNLPVCMVFPQRTINPKLLLKFLKAAQTGNINIILKMLDKGFYPDERGYMGRTALLVASRAGQLGAVKLLLNRGANIDVFDVTRKTALHEAMEQQHQDVIDELLSRKPNIDIPDCQGRYPLTIAAELGMRNNIETLIDKKADINQLYGLFFQSIQSSRINILRNILGVGFNPDARGERGETALLIASELGYIDIVKILLERKTDINAVDNEQRTALHVALGGNQQVIVDFLLSRAPNVNALDFLGRSPLSMAIEIRQNNTVKKLIEMGADVNHTTGYGWHVFLLAVNTGCLNIFKQLLPLVDINLTNSKGQSALHLSALYGNLEIMNELLVWGANIDQKGDAGRSAIYYTVINQRKECFKLLYEKGADLKDTLVRCIGISETHLLRQMEITQASTEKRNALIAQLSTEWNKLTLL